MKDVIFPIKLFSVTKSGEPIIVEGASGIRSWAGRGSFRPPGTYQRWTLAAEFSDLEAWLGRRIPLDELHRGFTVVGDRSEIDFIFYTLDKSVDDEIAGFWFIADRGQFEKLQMAVPEVLIIND